MDNLQTHINTYPGKTSCHTKEYLSRFWRESSNSAVFVVMEKHSVCGIWMNSKYSIILTGLTRREKGLCASDRPGWIYRV